MNITKESTGTLTALIKIDLNEADYQEPVKKVLKDYQKNAQMPGFRKGRVPFGMVQKMYGKTVLAEELNKIVSDKLNNYIVEEKLDVLGYPLPNVEKEGPMDIENQKEFSFYFDIALKPEFELALNEELEVEALEISVSEEEVDKQIDNLRRRHGKRINPEKVEDMDLVYGTMEELDEEGNVKEGGVVKENAVILVDSIRLKTIKKKFIDKKVGSSFKFDVKKAFNNETEISSLLAVEKDKLDELNAEFRMTVTEISRMELAEMNEEFFAAVYKGDDLKTEEDLKARVEKDLAANYANESDIMVFNKTVDALIEKSAIELPDEFMKRWILSQSTAENTITEEQLENQYDSYGKSLRWQLIEEKITKQNEISVQPEEVKNEVAALLMGQFGMEDNEENRERVEQYIASILQNQDEYRRVYEQLLNKKMTKLFKEKVKLTKKAVSYDEFVKLATEQAQ